MQKYPFNKKPRNIERLVLAIVGNDTRKVRRWVRDVKRHRYPICWISKPSFLYSSKKNREKYKTIAAAVVEILAHHIEGQTPPFWARETEPLSDVVFLIPLCDVREDLRLWSMKTTPECMAKLNVYACDCFLDV